MKGICMSKNLIDATVTEEDLKFILGTFDEMKNRMKFAITLDKEEKASLLRLSDKNRMFMKKVLDVMQQHPDVLPPRFDMEAFRKDVELHFQLFTILDKARLFVEMVEDIFRLSGSEGYFSALSVYKLLKAANATSGDLDASLDELGRSFVRKSTAEKADVPPIEPKKP
jgi:hypothetical protein